LARELNDAPPNAGQPSGPAEEAILNQFDSLLEIAEGVADVDARVHLKDALETARQAWKDGDKELSTRITHELVPWIEENTDRLEPEQARLLILGLRNLHRLEQ
jgi:hypothetical protein